jgi:hypothetical protein
MERASSLNPMELKGLVYGRTERILTGSTELSLSSTPAHRH